MLILLILLWPLVAVPFFNWLDYRLTKDGGKPWYAKYFLDRAIASLIHMFILTPVNGVDYTMMSFWELIWIFMTYILYHCCTFWVEYEIIRNLWTGNAILYFDDKENDSGWIDGFFSWLTRNIGDSALIFHFFCKAAAVYGAIFYGHQVYEMVIHLR